MPSNKKLTENQFTEKKSLVLFHSEHFGELFEADKNRLYSYIYAFVSDPVAADDIFQETCLTLWKEFKKFELGTNFSKWANGIAFNRVLIFRRQQKKYTLGLSDEFIEELSGTVTIIESLPVPPNQKLRYLQQCCTLLSLPLQQIYQSFYVHEQTAQEIANNTSRSIHAIRKGVHKLRKTLFDCVQDKAQEDLK